VCAQVAGACYGADGITATWLERLGMRETIEPWAERLMVGAGQSA
jgi:hypothetical protein